MTNWVTGLVFLLQGCVTRTCFLTVCFGIFLSNLGINFEGKLLVFSAELSSSNLKPKDSTHSHGDFESGKKRLWKIFFLK